MDELPKELEETPLNLQVVLDPETKCLTMKTHSEEIADNNDSLPLNIIPNDPLQQPPPTIVNLENASELDKLIYAERARLLNIKRPRKPIFKKSKAEDDAADKSEKSEETDSNQDLTQNQKSKLRMRRLRERETSEERDLRRFRHRIITNKVRLTQRLRNFENETFLKEITKRNTDRVKQNRLERKAKETPEQKALRKSQVNTKSRLAKIRRKAFKTPEELLDEKEKRLEYLEKFWSRYTEEERREHQKISREKAKERHRKNVEEWKHIEMMIRGEEPSEEVGVKSEIVDKI